MKRSILSGIVLLAAAASAPADMWFADDFNDGVLNPARWDCGGDGIAESGGVLGVNRDGSDDSLATVQTFSGDFKVEMDIRLISISWNDMFHGVTIRDDSGYYGNGVSFGFSQYGKLFRAQHQGNSTSYDYGAAGTNQQGEWLHWTLEKVGGDLTILVDGQPVCSQWAHRPLGGTVPDEVRVYLPGHYNDGGSGPGTSSEIDNFVIGSPAVPEPGMLALLGAGAVGFLLRRRR